MSSIINLAHVKILTSRLYTELMRWSDLKRKPFPINLVNICDQINNLIGFSIMTPIYKIADQDLPSRVIIDVVSPYNTKDNKLNYMIKYDRANNSLIGVNDHDMIILTSDMLYNSIVDLYKTFTDNPKYKVFYKDIHVTTINKQLIIKQNIDDNTLECIKQMHIMKYLIFKRAKELDNSDVLRIKELYNTYCIIDTELQRLWGFEENNRYHRFWVFPKCSCPKMDNEERLGSDQFVFTSSCIVHGSKE